jgi:tRNA threonylcarbamoyladenosine biosynthesis protein TsaB
MKVLALDSATNACSVALLDDGRLLARRFRALARGHAEVLMPMVEEAAREAGVALGAVDLIAVTVGPGAFTGIRIGLAAARAMALAAGRPCLGVTTTEAVAAAVPAAERARGTVLVVVETKRADVYAQPFAPDLEPLAPPLALGLDDLVAATRTRGGEVTLVGDAAARVAPALVAAGIPLTMSGAPGAPDAAIVAGRALSRWRALGQPTALAPPRPLYLRVPDVTLPGKTRG